MHHPQQLEEAAFGVYTPEKWSSNVYNLPRMRNKEILNKICDLAQTGIESLLQELERKTSEEFPTLLNHKRVEAQWVYWYRNDSQRQSLASFLEKTPLDETTIFNIAPQDKHAVVAVIMRQQGLWVGLHLAAGSVVDRKNLASKLQKAWERENALQLLKLLPVGYRLTLGEQSYDPQIISDKALGDIAQGLLASPSPLILGIDFSVAETLALVDNLATQIRLELQHILPLYRFASWSRDNDLIEAGKQIQELKAQKRRQLTSYNPGDQVRITAGPFLGKLGVVQETDTKAQVKVRVGKMSVIVSGSSLTLAPAVNNQQR